MKKWLKKCIRWILVALGILIIANASYEITIATEDWKIITYLVIIVLWLILILVLSGILNKLYQWWEKD